MNTEETKPEVQFEETLLDSSKIPTESLGEKLLEIMPYRQHDEMSTIKRACAYIIDSIENHRFSHSEHGTLTANRELLLNNAITQVINAQLAVEKAIKFTNNI